MNISATSAIPFGDKEGFMMFMTQNEIAHIMFGKALADLGIPIHAVLPAGNIEGMANWMLDHWLRHIDECVNLDIAVPDISTVDLNDEQQFYDYMKLHGDLHRQQNFKLGITT